MGAAKKPVATVKANFNTKTAAPAKAATGLTEETQKAVAQEEKKVEKKVEKKAVVKKEAPAAKVTEKKAAPAEKAVEKKVAAPAEKAVEKKAAPAEKAVEKKAEPVKKAVEKKEAPAAKISAEIILQYNGNDYTYDRLLQSAKDVWQYDQGRNVADFKTAKIYVKPDNNKAYVVVNGTEELSFDI